MFFEQPHRNTRTERLDLFNPLSVVFLRQGKKLPANIDEDAEEGDVSDEDSADEMEDDCKLMNGDVRPPLASLVLYLNVCLVAFRAALKTVRPRCAHVFSLSSSTRSLLKVEGRV